MAPESNRNEIWVAKCAGQVTVSAIKEMAMLSAKLESAASLACGLPSFQTPKPIRNAVETQLERDPKIGLHTPPDRLSGWRARMACPDCAPR